jgi:hypothetical protein
MADLSGRRVAVISTDGVEDGYCRIPIYWRPAPAGMSVLAFPNGRRLGPNELGSYPLPEFDLAQVPAHTQRRLRDRLDVRRRPARGCFFQ